jgi:hypothetical protein
MLKIATAEAIREFSTVHRVSLQEASRTLLRRELLQQVEDVETFTDLKEVLHRVVMMFAIADPYRT